MGMVDFAAAKAAFSLEEVCNWYGAKLKKEQSSLRGSCPICNGDGDRAFVVTPAKQMWHCFARCQRGGDSIAFVAAIENLPVREAAQKILERVESPSPTPAKALHELDYLLPEHERVQSLKIPAAKAAALGIGLANKGTMSSYVLFPLRDQTGKLVAYVGYHPEKGIKLPKSLTE